MRTLVLCSLAVLALATPRVRADELPPNGTWKLVVQTYADHGFLAFKTEKQGGKLTGEVLSSQPFLAGPKVKEVRIENDTINLTFALADIEATFEGKLVGDGPHKGKVLGVFRFRGNYHPAQLLATEDVELGPLTRGPIMNAVGALRRIAPKDRVGELKDLIEKHKGNVTLYHAYGALMIAASDAGLSADEVRKLWDQWQDDAKPYGPKWLEEVREYALGSLRGQKPYAKLSIELAQASEAGLSEDAPTATRAALAGALAEAAKLDGNETLAKEASARAEGFERKLDQEYLEKVPPFKPQAFKRENAQDDRVVLMELFTGSECPPCVAADVAFDALLKTFQPQDVVFLQYHLHIPRPDPLTNEDSLKRSEYYALRGTPTAYLNGMNDAPGGGGLAASEAKYKQLRESIEPKLGGKKRASVDLNIKRDGQKLAIQATAEVAANSPGKPMLRLALAEKTIRFAGGNAVRFHHHVVRTMPGGTEGKPLKSGKASFDVTVDLDALKTDLEKYLADFEAKTSVFPNSKPPIELKDLIIVAFVQDDDDKAIWHAVRQEVK